MLTIKLIPFGEIPEELLTVISKELRLNLNIIADITSALNLNKKFYNPLRLQYRADDILRFLTKYKTKVLAIINEDLYTDGLNFIFGQAQLNGNVAIVSICRLNPAFYRKPINKSLLIQRTVKEIIHEVGHMLGLRHCSNEKCVMSFSNTIFDVDKKSKNLCNKCKLQLGV